MFYAILPRQLTQCGSAVLTLDHPAKDREGRGRYASGSAHKLNAITGTAYTLELGEAPSVGRSGFARIAIAKDRHGEVRQHAAAKQIATLHLESKEGDDALGWRLDGPSRSDANDAFRPTYLMQRASEYLAERSTPVSQSQVLKDVQGKQQYLKDALTRLVEEGFARCTDGPRNALLYEHVKPFRDAP